MVASPLRAVAVATVALALLAGCGSGQTASPAASAPMPTAAETPAPTERVDVAATVTQTLNDPAFTASVALTGTLQLDDVAIAVTGEMRIRGDDTYLHIVADAPNLPTGQFESIRLGSDAYERTDAGLWIHQPAGEPDTGGLEAGFDFTSLRAEGTRRLDGETYQLLLPVGGTPMTPSSLGFDNPTIEGFEGSVEFLADDAGSPVALLVAGTWRQLVADGMADASFELTFRFERIGQWVKIEKPAQAWEQWGSERLGYSVSYPSGWEASPVAATEEVRDYDLFLGPIDEEVHVYRYDLESDTTPGMWYQWEADWIADTYDRQPEHWQDLTVADLPARQFTLHFTAADGGEVLLMDVMVIGDDAVWNICWYSVAGSEEADRTLFESLLSTFQPAA